MGTPVEEKKREGKIGAEGGRGLYVGKVGGPGLPSSDTRQMRTEGGGSWLAAPSCCGAAKDMARGSHGGGGDEGRGRAPAKDADEMAASQLPWPG
jgi:hypothetical protein